MTVFSVATHQEHLAYDGTIALLVNVNVEFSFLFVVGPDEKVDSSIASHLIGGDFKSCFGVVNFQPFSHVADGFVGTTHVGEFSQCEHRSPIVQRLFKWNVLIDDISAANQDVVNIFKPECGRAFGNPRIANIRSVGAGRR